MKTQTDIRSFYEFQPLVSLDHAWQIGFVIGLLIALASVTIWIHHRSVRKASWSLGLLLNATRLTMLGLLCLFFLNPVKRTETRFEKPSRLVFLVDTSLSMGLVDPLDPNRRSQDESRISKVKNWLTQTDAIRQLIEHHELEFFQFGGSDSIQSVAIFPKANSIATQSLRPSNPMQQDLLRRYRQWIGIGKATIVFGGLAIITILCAIALGLFRPADRVIVRLYQVSIPGILLTVLLVAIVDLNTSELNWLTSVGLTTFPENLALAESSESPEQENSAEDLDRNKFKWVESLNSKGTTTPIGSALQQIINRERGGAIAGIILISDGNSNSGLRIEQATAEAANAGIRLYPVGIGSRIPLPNLSVTDFQAPPKTYPGDPFQLKAIIKNLNMQTADITVQLFSQSTTDDSKEILEDEQTVKVDEVSSDLTTVKFSVTPERVGKIRYTIRVRPLQNESNRNDNQLSSSVEVIERKTKILIIAGGPTREFRFLRNQFFRDPEIESHVWLQSAKQGVDQESDQLLDQFPAKQDDMFQYDCLIAFDPDWRMLTPDQSQLLENWIA
ncbi:MAG: VWA domain-containing protein, partial [Planctomycetota bacterium]